MCLECRTEPQRRADGSGWIFGTAWYKIWTTSPNIARSIVHPYAIHVADALHVLLQYRERIVFLGKAIDEETGNQLVATMLYLDSENKKDLNLYINCSGGDVSGIRQTLSHALLNSAYSADMHHRSLSVDQQIAWLCCRLSLAWPYMTLCGTSNQMW